MSRVSQWRKVALAGVGVMLALVAAPAPAADARDDVLAAYDAYRAHDVKRLDRYVKRLRGHVLEPYVVYWRLAADLDDAAPDAIRSFIEQNSDTPISERLRAQWLRQLGEKEEWDLFDAEFPHLVRDDVELTCYALQSRMRKNESRALADARALWFVGRSMPDSCDPLFDALIETKRLSPEDIWMRLRLALEAGQVSLARHLSGLLPKGQGPDGRTLRRIASNPRRYLDGKRLNHKTRAGREETIFAVHRLARTSPDQAADRWSRIESDFDAGARAYVWGLIAYFAARRHEPEALTWYAHADDLSDLQLEWKARAGLLAHDWAAVLDAIDTMTEKESRQSNWRYWRARALKALDRGSEAVALLKPLSAEFNFYGQLATEELGGAVSAPAATYTPAAEDLIAMRARPGIRRALALYRLDLRFDATREWLWAIRGFNDRELLTAAEVARRYGIHDRVISTASRTVDLHDFGLRYIAPYRDVLKARAEELDLDEAWVYGVIRQESRFVADARSHAGARGLMQLMPATARWVARKLGLKNWRWSRVTDIDMNVDLGTYYLRYVLDELDGSTVLASAAYNAGPNRARQWRPDDAVEGAIFAESIPFTETRNYVTKVMSSAAYYAWAFTERPQSLKDRLGTITPGGADELALGGPLD